MGRRYSETETIAIVRDLTAGRLRMFLAAQIVRPVAGNEGPAFREADLARLQLLCDLKECYGLQEDALAMVMSLVDQLSTARGDMRALIEAVAAESDEVRLRIGGQIRQSRRLRD